MFWPGEYSTTVVQEDHLIEGKGCQVGSDCVIRHLPNHKGKIAAFGMLTITVCVFCVCTLNKMFTNLCLIDTRIKRGNGEVG